MAETTERGAVRIRRFRHRGRVSQVSIYLGKQLRFFINENDWKVLPMAAVIAALVGMVIRNRFFINMEGSIFGALALTCVAIWNGSFNSIQSVCRERAIIKREHRSGMHISSYIFAHMVYQLLLCAAQTGLTMYVLYLIGIKFPERGFMTPWMIVDIAISMLLISYAADMMSLFLSSISHTTTGAMTIMPFVLIFQLVFSGGIIPLPAWSQSLSNYTISNYGIRVIAAQSGYNERPMVTVWNTLSGMRDTEVGGTFTLGQALDLLDSPAVEKRRDQVVLKSHTVGDLIRFFQLEDQELLAFLPKDYTVNEEMTLGQIADLLKGNERLQQQRDRSFTVKMRIGDLFELFGEENIKALVEEQTAAASYNPAYELSEKNIVDNWITLGMFILFFALLSTLVLERIDRDKR